MQTPSPFLHAGFIAGTGLTYAFHVVLTVYALRRGQCDLEACGKFLSLGLIFFFNVLLLFSAMTVAGSHWKRAPLQLKRIAGTQWAACRIAAEHTGRIFFQ